MAGSAERIGMEQIEAGFRLFKQPYFALFECAPGTTGKIGRLIYSYTDGDRDGQGWQELHANLQVLEATAPQTPHFLLFYTALDKNGTITPSTPYAGSTKLRMQAYSYMPATTSIAGAAPGVYPGHSDFLAYLQNELRYEKEKNISLENEVEDLRQELQAAEEAQQVSGPRIDGIIGQIGEATNAYPVLGEIFRDWSTVLKHKMFPTQPLQRQYAGAAGSMGKVDPNASPEPVIKNALRTLQAWYTKEHGGEGTDEERHMRGIKQFAADLHALATLTADDDVMHLALKKLRAF